MKIYFTNALFQKRGRILNIKHRHFLLPPNARFHSALPDHFPVMQKSARSLPPRQECPPRSDKEVQTTEICTHKLQCRQESLA